MGRKAIPDLDRKIIACAIEVGGSQNANVDFSTRKIADMLSISEFTVFSRFHSKIGLRNAVLQSIEDEYYQAVNNFLKEKEKEPLASLLEYCFEFYVEHPSYTTFVCNYSPLVMRSRGDKDLYQGFERVSLEHSQILDHYLACSSLTQRQFLWNAMNRRVILQAQMVICSLQQDSPAYRQLAIGCLQQGLRSLFKGA
jgi:AcrR family transcriptional regulator